jgi:hypothetical protein
MKKQSCILHANGRGNFKKFQKFQKIRFFVKMKKRCLFPFTFFQPIHFLKTDLFFFKKCQKVWTKVAKVSKIRIFEGSLVSKNVKKVHFSFLLIFIFEIFWKSQKKVFFWKKKWREKRPFWKKCEKI